MLGRGVGIRARIDRLATHLLRAADERRKVSAELPRDGKFSVPFVKLGQQVKPPLQAIAYQPATEWEQEGQQYQRTDARKRHRYRLDSTVHDGDVVRRDANPLVLCGRQVSHLMVGRVRVMGSS